MGPGKEVSSHPRLLAWLRCLRGTAGGACGGRGLSSASDPCDSRSRRRRAGRPASSSHRQGKLYRSSPHLRIGDSDAVYPAAARLIEATLQYDAAGHACGLSVTSKVAQSQMGRSRPRRLPAADQLQRSRPSPTLAAGTSSSARPRPPSAPPRATWACDRSIIKRASESKPTSWSASSHWPCGARWKCGCTAKAWARVHASSSPRSARSRAWTWSSPSGAKSQLAKCACESSHAPIGTWPNCSPASAWTCPPAAESCSAENCRLTPHPPL